MPDLVLDPTTPLLALRELRDQRSHDTRFGRSEPGSAAQILLEGARVPLLDPRRPADRWEWIDTAPYVRRPGRTSLDRMPPSSWPATLSLDLADPAVWPVVDRRLLEAYAECPNTGLPGYARIVPMSLEDAPLFAGWAFMVVTDLGADFIRIEKGKAATGLDPTPENVIAFRALLVRALLCTSER